MTSFNYQSNRVLTKSITQDDIDWDYMESYIRTMEKQVITDVVDYKDSMITTAKELIYV